MRQLLEAGVHFGHQTRFWSPKMAPYIYGHRNKIHIINLERTLAMLNEALNYLSSVASKGGSIMFVGTKRQAGAIVQEQAQRANCPYVYHRWLGGMLTNNRTVRNSIDRLNELDDIISGDGLSKMAKREAMRIEREQFRLNRNLAGIREMKGIPDVLFVIDVKYENIAIKEANKLEIPVVAIVDTNCNPDGVDYIIPGNDDAISAIRLYCTSAADAIIAGNAIARASAGHFADMDGDSETSPLVTAEFTALTGARAAVAPSRETVLVADESEEAEAPDEEQQADSESADILQEAVEPVEEITAKPSDPEPAKEALAEPSDPQPAKEALAEPSDPQPAEEVAAEPSGPEPTDDSTEIPDEPAGFGELNESELEEYEQTSSKAGKIRYLNQLGWEIDAIVEKVETTRAYVRSTLKSRTKS